MSDTNLSRDEFEKQLAQKTTEMIQVLEKEHQKDIQCIRKAILEVADEQNWARITDRKMVERWVSTGLTPLRVVFGSKFKMYFASWTVDEEPMCIVIEWLL